MEHEISVRRLNQQTSAVLSEVAEGHAITVSSAGRRIARIVPVVPLPAGLAQLVAEGAAIGPTQSGPICLPPATSKGDLNVAAAMARDRELEPW